MQNLIIFKRLLAIFAVAFLGLSSGCSDESNGDLTPPELTLDKTGERSTLVRFVDLAGDVEEGAAVDVRIEPDATVGEVDQSEQGRWTCSLSDLDVGTSTVIVSAEDEAGNLSSLTFFLTYDGFALDELVSPTVERAKTLTGTYDPYNVGSIQVALKGEEPGAADLESSDGTWSFLLEGLADGENKVTLEAFEDENATSSLRSLKVEITVQAVTIDVVDDLTNQSEQTISGSFDPSQVDAVLVKIDGGEELPATVQDGGWSYLVAGLDEEDTYDVSVVARKDGQKVVTEKTVITLDLTAPFAEETNPREGAVDVEAETDISVLLSESLDPDTFGERSLVMVDAGGNEVDGQAAYSEIFRVAIFTVAEGLALDSGTTYTMSFGEGITDLAGNPLDDFSWSFTTAEGSP